MSASKPVAWFDDFSAIPHGITVDSVVGASQGMIVPTTGGLQERIDRAVSYVRRYCGWHVFPIVTTKVRLDGSGSDLLMLPSLRVLDIVSVSECGQELDVKNLQWSSKGILSKASGLWSSRLGSILVEFEHGWNSCLDIESVIISMVARGVSSPVPGRSSLTVGQRMETFASVGGSFGDVVPFEKERRVFSQYRLPALSGFN